MIKNKIQIINPDSKDYIKIRPFLMNSVNIVVSFEKFYTKGSIHQLPFEEIVNMTDLIHELKQPQINSKTEPLIQGNLIGYHTIEYSPNEKNKFRELHQHLEKACSEHILSGKNINDLLMKFDYVSMEKVESLFIPVTKLSELFKLTGKDVKNYVVANWRNFRFEFDYHKYSDICIVSEGNSVKIGFEHEKGEQLYMLPPHDTKLTWMDIPKKYLSLENALS